ncbi:hypothetical protein [Azorhizobium doebereinerae]|uniref:hypothetical protein n=1 Tax=Azorhizobium doebereinerae TaxID=281091 RepID=UPI0004255A6D|nr:hypothetical protein [Azorhizobium doebereinerae]
MSISREGEGPGAATEFERWLRDTFAAEGAFTALVILVEIGETHVSLLASTYLNIIGDDIDWTQVVTLFAGSGLKWDGAAFFPMLDADGPLENEEARMRLRAVEARVRDNRLVLNEGEFFDAWGRRLKIEEIILS